MALFAKMTGQTEEQVWQWKKADWLDFADRLDALQKRLDAKK
jgi:hypothetical protein